MPSIEITDVFRGRLVPSDLLSSEGTLIFPTTQRDLDRGGYIFKVTGDDFVFALSAQNGSIVLQRNDTVSVLTTEELPRNVDVRIVTIRWTHDELLLSCAGLTDRQSAKVPTVPVAPPPTLLRWARKQNLLPAVDYASEAEFNQRVYSSLATLQHVIDEAGAYDQFWDITYDGNRIADRRPKRETTLHRAIQCLLSDQMLMASIEVVPEYRTGVGNVDFMFLGSIAGKGLGRLCAEFKPAHSHDLLRGLEVQLPTYMRNKGVGFGAYCVLNFGGDWFDNPGHETGDQINGRLQLVSIRRRPAAVEGIRVFVINLSKPRSASRRT